MWNARCAEKTGICLPPPGFAWQDVPVLLTEPHETSTGDHLMGGHSKTRAPWVCRASDTLT